MDSIFLPKNLHLKGTISTEGEITLPLKIIDTKDVLPLDELIFALLQLAKKTIEKAGIIFFNEDTCLITPGRFYNVLYRDNPSCWRSTRINIAGLKWEGLELLNSDSLEVQGSVGIEEHFIPPKIYVVWFCIKINKDAKFVTDSRFILIVADDKNTTVMPSRGNLNDLPKDKWLMLPMGKFSATKKGQVRFSLTNFDPNWKSGIHLAGVLIAPDLLPI